MGWRRVFQLPEKEEQGKQVTAVSEQVSLLSHIPLFQERAAIREFDGNQTREEAERGAVEEIKSLPEGSLSKDQAIKNAEDVLGARVVSEGQSKAILSLPVGWKGDNSND